MLQAFIDEASRTIAEITSASPRELYLATGILAAAAELMYLAERPKNEQPKSLRGPAFIRQVVRPSSVRFELIRWLTPTSWYDLETTPYVGRTPLSADQYLRALNRYPSRLVFETEQESAKIYPFRRR